ncbi:uncharacterized protein Z520_00776 [Fonsecaea multimorphosa CBS 102226]|uniref:Uncharacterized protein n=1 Tax=Fonsecaea multimorphosa CBS 102226 TaxID=1442371 RepID=A0A0D2L4U0_9EURO|nr:uncharacterized protein Z520_00776 [Fonsecaea multimorphosa CBS 102226]KIY04084.1 hypothetical protein Z520_00776 [Fonsecaea multimorphosa CBS 102226]OAL31918.1 hypothetical protein AYO22_00788 [Fonsecaea multimorphosa]
MSDHKDRRPAKQRRLHGIPLLEQPSPVEDDEDSSSSSSSSSIQLPTTRLSHRLLKSSNSLPTENSSSDGESGEEDVEETTSSSDSEDSDSDDMSEEDEEDEGDDVEDHVAASGPGIPRYTTLPSRGSDLKSRLQSFLPQLQQANEELENSGEVVDNRIDHVSDEAEHYIEMEVGLGVLSEQNDDATQVRLPHTLPSEDEDNEDDDEIKDGQEGLEHSVLSPLIGMNGTKGIKRKIEELG